MRLCISRDKGGQTMLGMKVVISYNPHALFSIFIIILNIIDISIKKNNVNNDLIRYEYLFI